VSGKTVEDLIARLAQGKSLVDAAFHLILNAADRRWT